MTAVEDVDARVRRWARDADGGGFIELLPEIEYLVEQLFHDYEPCGGAAWPDFWERCRNWLDNVGEDEQRTLFAFIPHLLFVPRQEFDALYRTAVEEHVVPWLVDQLALPLDDVAAAAARIDGALRRTAFLPITDSLRINAFYHATGVRGADFRVEARTLAAMADPIRATPGCDGEAFRQSMLARVDGMLREKRVEYIVLLEDFVGTGEQMGGAVDFAAAVPGGRPVLVVPLIVCPPGAERGHALAEAYAPRLRFDPVFALPSTAMLREKPTVGEPRGYAQVREVIRRYTDRFAGGAFGRNNTGALVVMHTNCPNNTLPLVRQATNWSPLFPRAGR